MTLLSPHSTPTCEPLIKLFLKASWNQFKKHFANLPQTLIYWLRLLTLKVSNPVFNKIIIFVKFLRLYLDFFLPNRNLPTFQNLCHAHTRTLWYAVCVNASKNTRRVGRKHCAKSSPDTLLIIFSVFTLFYVLHPHFSFFISRLWNVKKSFQHLPGCFSSLLLLLTYYFYY